MILIIQSIIACIVFTLIIIPSQYKNPVKYIRSYPPRIRKRAESLPQYKNFIHKEEKRQVIVKIVAALLIAVILSLVAYFSGAKSFFSTYFHVFMLFFAVNIYDVFILDIGLFCHSKKLRIPGTEDMDKEYKNPWFHVVGGIKGTAIGAVVALLSGAITHIISFL
ncbi:UNVERIFIED_CONTAM: hypothetical protein Cloal_1641 [Acetivibrio alkalicellulosi]